MNKQPVIVAIPLLPQNAKAIATYAEKENTDPGSFCCELFHKALAERFGTKQMTALIVLDDQQQALVESIARLVDCPVQQVLESGQRITMRMFQTLEGELLERAEKDGGKPDLAKMMEEWQREMQRQAGGKGKKKKQRRGRR